MIICHMLLCDTTKGNYMCTSTSKAKKYFNIIKIFLILFVLYNGILSLYNQETTEKNNILNLDLFFIQNTEQYITATYSIFGLIITFLILLFPIVYLYFKKETSKEKQLANKYIMLWYLFWIIFTIVLCSINIDTYIIKSYWNKNLFLISFHKILILSIIIPLVSKTKLIFKKK